MGPRPNFEPSFIANQLRACHYVGFRLKWDDGPINFGCSTQLRHVLSAWGDNGTDSNPVTTDPSQVKVTDSDDFAEGRETQNVMTYDYNQTSGLWYVQYPATATPPYPYITSLTTLSQGEDPCTGTETIVSDTLVVRNLSVADATALHYEVGVKDSSNICSFETKLSGVTWESGADIPQITLVHPSDKAHYLIVDWEFKAGEVPPLREVTISTRLKLPRKNTIYYNDVKFGYGNPPIYPPSLPQIPGFDWVIITPGISPLGTHGFVIGSFELFEDLVSETPIVKNYLQHEYAADEDPNQHHFELAYLETWGTYYVKNLKFGYSDSEVTNLPGFSAWTHTDETAHSFGPGCTVTADLSGRSPDEWSLGGQCIPAVSQWGLLIIALSLLTVGSVIVKKRRMET